MVRIENNMAEIVTWSTSTKIAKITLDPSTNTAAWGRGLL